MKKYLSILVISLSLFFIGIFNVNASDAGYTIEKYNVDVKVNENNVYEITEIIDVHFDMLSHGIYREIPLKNSVHRLLDGKEIQNDFKAKISDVSVNYDYTSYKESGNLVLKVGDADYYADEYTTYEISYKYDVGDDNITEYDDIYLGIIGTGWDTSINNVTFNITMPKEFDETKLNFTIGKYGSTDNTSVEYIVNNNTISGRVTRLLYPNEGITIRVELPEGYFVNERENIDYTKTIIYGVMIFVGFAVIISYILWNKYGKIQHLVVPVEFYPPKGMTSAEVGHLIDGRVDDKDVVSLIIYWANLGYLEIKEENKKFTLIKLNELPETSESYEKTVFNKIFEKGTEIKLSSLEEKFYTTLMSAKIMIGKKHKVYDTSHYLLGFYLFFIALFPIFLTLILSGNFLQSTLNKNKMLLIGLIILLGFNLIYSLVLLFKNKKRTQEGHTYLEKLLGLKNFIEKAEKDKLERLVNENPKYFYNVLPFAYVLGVSDVWCKQFESILVAQPEWYSGSSMDNFNTYLFYRNLNRALTKTTHAMSSVPVNTSSGGGSLSGGGGFSGGGFGGGGGGRW